MDYNSDGIPVLNPSQEKVVSGIVKKIPRFSSLVDVFSFLSIVENKCLSRGMKELCPAVASRLLDGAALSWYTSELGVDCKKFWGEFKKKCGKICGRTYS